MNILVLNTYYYPNLVGGCEHSVKLLAEGLVKAGNKVAVYCIDNLKSKHMYEERINGVHVYRGSGGLYDIKAKMRLKKAPINILLNKFVELNNKTAIQEIEEILYKENIQVVHTNNLYGISFSVWKAIKEKGIPIVHTIRDYWIISPTYSLNYLKKGKIEKWLHGIYQRHYRNLSRFVSIASAPSQYTLDKYLQFHYFQNAKCACVSNCIEIDKEQVNKNIICQKEKISSRVKFIYIGSLIEIKGIDILLSAFSKIDDDDIELWICGSGPLEQLVKQYVKSDNRIKYYGQVSIDKRNLLLKECDVLIIPSQFDEPFGRVVIEANYFGLPVIGSNRGGIPEIIKHISTGEVFETEEELQEKIVKFSNRRFIQSFYPKIEEGISEYSQEKQIERFMSIYQRVINEK